jgi:hypothetical protein
MSARSVRFIFILLSREMLLAGPGDIVNNCKWRIFRLTRETDGSGVESSRKNATSEVSLLVAGEPLTTWQRMKVEMFERRGML